MSDPVLTLQVLVDAYSQRLRLALADVYGLAAQALAQEGFVSTQAVNLGIHKHMDEFSTSGGGGHAAK